MTFMMQRFSQGPSWLYFDIEGTREEFDLEAEGDTTEYYAVTGEDGFDNAPPFWGFVKDGGEIEDLDGRHGIFGTVKDNVILKVYGVSSLNGASISRFKEFGASSNSKVEGNATAITATASGELSDILVEGANKTALTITIDGTAYPVKANGRIVDLPADDSGEVVSTSVINSTRRPDGTIVNKTISFINPEAADSDVAKFMAAINTLSQNSTIKGGLVVVEKRAIS